MFGNRARRVAGNIFLQFAKRSLHKGSNPGKIPDPLSGSDIRYSINDMPRALKAHAPLQKNIPCTSEMRLDAIHTFSYHRWYK